MRPTRVITQNPGKKHFNLNEANLCVTVLVQVGLKFGSLAFYFYKVFLLLHFSVAIILPCWWIFCAPPWIVIFSAKCILDQPYCVFVTRPLTQRTPSQLIPGSRAVQSHRRHLLGATGENRFGAHRKSVACHLSSMNPCGGLNRRQHQHHETALIPAIIGLDEPSIHPTHPLDFLVTHLKAISVIPVF
jgi:hypothetical protein